MKIFKTKDFWLAVVVTLIASVSGQVLAKLPGVKIIGAMVIALLIGMFYQLIKPIKANTKQGVGFISNKFLRLGIILLGFKLNLVELMESGVKTLLLALVVVTFTILAVYIIAKKLGVNDELSLLAASGCGVCGAAAVMGVSPQVKAKSDESVLAVAVVCILGTVFTLIEVFLRPYLGLTPTQFGILNGASLHEIAHAVAAAGAGGEVTLKVALIMKLSRVLMLAPVALIIGIYYHKKHNTSGGAKTKLPIPWFMLGFLIMSALGTFIVSKFGVATKTLIDELTLVAYIFLGMAMTALGMSVNFKVIAQKGGKIFVASTIASVLLFLLAYVSARTFF